jgi:hypothetical protein
MMNQNQRGMDWAVIDAIGAVGVGVLFVMWADIMYGTTGTVYVNSIAIYLLIGAMLLIAGAGTLVALHGFHRGDAGQTQLDEAAR